jgi:pimeloyl-ACP methyl ester carboxylesterase
MSVPEQLAKFSPLRHDQTFMLDAQCHSACGGGKGSTQTACRTRVERCLQPGLVRCRGLGGDEIHVGQSSRAARVCQILKPCRAPKAAGIEDAAAEATPLTAWWAPPGQTKYLILQGADDQIAPPENGVLLQQELGGRATLVNVPGAGHLLPLEKT